MSGEQEHVLLHTFHHIIFDGWSEDIFNRELMSLYEAFSKGKQNPLKPLALQYADFAVWQRRWLAGEKLAGDLQYWKQQLSGIPELLDLPKDRPRQARQTFAASLHHVSA